MNTSEITFEQLPAAVSQLFQKLENIERLLTLRQAKQPEADQWLDLQSLCAYLPDNPARQTVYQWVHTAQIPYHKGSKRLRFLKSEIDAWLKEGRRKTIGEMKSDGPEYLTVRKAL